VLPVSGRIGRILLQMCEKAIQQGEVNSNVSAQSLEDMLTVILSGLGRFNMVYRDARRTSDLIKSMKLLLIGEVFRVSSNA
jgi:hypothetical protein